MPLLDHTRLTNHHELRCAHTFLSYIAHGYVWMNGDSDVMRVLPAQVAVPWVGVSRMLEVDPILSHSSFCLANWKVIYPEK